MKLDRELTIRLVILSIHTPGYFFEFAKKFTNLRKNFVFGLSSHSMKSTKCAKIFLLFDEQWSLGLLKHFSYISNGDHLMVKFSFSAETKKKLKIWRRNWLNYNRETLCDKLSKEDWNIDAEETHTFLLQHMSFLDKTSYEVCLSCIKLLPRYPYF